MKQTQPPIGISFSCDNLSNKNKSVWTVENASQFLSLSTNEEKIKLIQNIFHIQEEDYNCNQVLTFLVDFHLGNAEFCKMSKFNDKQTFFVCDSLSILLDEAILLSSAEPNFDYDDLRNQQAHKFHSLFKNSTDLEFASHEIKEILSFITSTFLRPLRLILLQILNPPCYTKFSVFQKVFQPSKPDPLNEFVEQRNVNNLEFPSFVLPKDSNNLISDFEKYQNEMKIISDERIKLLNDRINELETQLKDDQ